MRKLFWFLVVLVVLAVGADRAADYVAEQAIADKVQTSQHLRSAPDVDVTGFPFLTQLYRQRFDEVTATAADVPVGQGRRSVTLSRLSLTFFDVRADRRFTRFEAATGRARATLPYDELSRVVGLQVGYGGRGQVRARKTFTVAGQRLRPTITVDPQMVDGALTFTNSTLENGIPAPVTAALRQAFAIDVPLTKLPFDVRVSSVRADKAGIELRLVGKDLRYSR